jgi:hypothetical protein
MAFVSQQTKAQLTPAIKAVLKKYGVKGSIAVRGHSELAVTLSEGAIDFGADHHQVNTAWAHEHYTGTARDFLVELVAAMKGPDYFDESDAMTDYFHCSHYISIDVGRWNKPYKLLEAVV